MYMCICAFKCSFSHEHVLNSTKFNKLRQGRTKNPCLCPLLLFLIPGLSPHVMGHSLHSLHSDQEQEVGGTSRMIGGVLSSESSSSSSSSLSSDLGSTVSSSVSAASMVQSTFRVEVA